jgi:hypothetical protein
MLVTFARLERATKFGLPRSLCGCCRSIRQRRWLGNLRPNYSSPPLHGARIAELVLSDPGLRSKWMVDLQDMSARIVSIRSQLVRELRDRGAPCPSGNHWCVVCRMHAHGVPRSKWRDFLALLVSLYILHLLQKRPRCVAPPLPFFHS